MILTGWHDNTADNPWNPDPDQWVISGQRTGDEMSHAWIAVTHLDEEGYQKILAERQANGTVTGGVLQNR
jgi:glutamate/tyrosine decarboxylase-like PLP-dependent enzyme